MLTKVKCPYCNAGLDVKPSRKNKCPNCGEYILVRKGKLLTLEDAEIEDWLARVDQFRVTKKNFLEEREKLSQHFGQKASINDTAWAILNLLLREKYSHSDLNLIYFEMAHIVGLEGRNPKQILAKAHEQNLLEYKSQGIKKIQIDNVNDDEICEACRKLAGKVYSIDQALKELPVPNNCECETGCRCWYSWEIGLSE